MNELVRDLDPKYVPTMVGHGRRRIAPRRAVTGLAGQKVHPYQVWPWREKNCTRESGNGVVPTDRRPDRQSDSSIPPSNFIERGYKNGDKTHSNTQN